MDADFQQLQEYVVPAAPELFPADVFSREAYVAAVRGRGRALRGAERDREDNGGRVGEGAVTHT